MAERDLAKVEATGSSPVSRSVRLIVGFWIIWAAILALAVLVVISRLPSVVIVRP